MIDEPRQKTPTNRADRSTAAETRNPLTTLPSYRKLLALPEETQAVLRDILGELRADAARRAEQSWQRKKGPMAVYWKAVSVYAFHLRRDLKPVDSTARHARTRGHTI